jgi:hypothetical protein
MTDTHAGLSSHNSLNLTTRVEHRDERIEQTSTKNVRRIPSYQVPVGVRFLGAPQSRATATSSASSSTAPRRLPREMVVLDPFEEALLELARSALRNRLAVAERRGKMTAVEGGKRGDRTA